MVLTDSSSFFRETSRNCAKICRTTSSTIADFALDGSCEKVYHNIVPDLIINGLFGSSVKGLVLLFVQFPDNR